MMLRRNFLRMVVAGLVAIPTAAEAGIFDHWSKPRVVPKKSSKLATRNILKTKRPSYEGRQDVAFASDEKPGTLIIKTKERALYRVLGDGKHVEIFRRKSSGPAPPRSGTPASRGGIA